MEIGNNVSVKSLPVQTHLISAPRGRLVIGDRVSIGYAVAIAAQCAIEIGNDVQISPYVIIMDSDYHVPGKRGAEPERTPVHIGSGTHVGVHATILRGTILGEGAEVAPGSVVSGLVPAGEFVAGNPARIRDRNAIGAITANIEDQIIDIAARTLGLDRRAITRDQALQNLPQWDSLGVLRMLLVLEEAFDIRLDEDHLLSATRVSDVITMVKDLA